MNQFTSFERFDISAQQAAIVERFIFSRHQNIMFGKKKNPKKRITTKESAHNLNRDIEGELVPHEMGLELDEIERLLELLGREDENRVVMRRKVGGILDTAKGLILWLVPNKKKLHDVQEQLHKKIEEIAEQREKLAKLRKKKKLVENDLPDDIAPESIEYPQKISPDDILNSIVAAKERLEQPIPKPKTSLVEKKHAELILNVLLQLKYDEATRFARYITQMTYKHLNRTPEEQAAYLEQLKRKVVEDAEEELEKIRTLSGFGKNLHTLIDDAGEVVQDNYDAAAKVIKQWVGNKSEMDK